MLQIRSVSAPSSIFETPAWGHVQCSVEGIIVDGGYPPRANWSDSPTWASVAGMKEEKICVCNWAKHLEYSPETHLYFLKGLSQKVWHIAKSVLFFHPQQKCPARLPTLLCAERIFTVNDICSRLYGTVLSRSAESFKSYFCGSIIYLREKERKRFRNEIYNMLDSYLIIRVFLWKSPT